MNAKRHRYVRSRRKGNTLLPVMIERIEIPGLPKTVAYVRAKEKTPEQIATLFSKSSLWIANQASY